MSARLSPYAERVVESTAQTALSDSLDARRLNSDILSLRLCSGSGTLLLTGTVPSGMEPSLYAATVPPCCMWTLLEVCQRQYTVNCLLVLAEHLHEVGTQSCLPLVQAAIRLRRTSSCPLSCRTYGPGVSLQTATMPRSYPTLSGISALNALLRLRICTPPRLNFKFSSTAPQWQFTYLRFRSCLWYKNVLPHTYALRSCVLTAL